MEKTRHANLHVSESLKIHFQNNLETEAPGVEDKLYKNFVTE